MNDLISRQAAIDVLTRRINEFEGILADIRKKNVDDSVCGLCEYDCDHGLDGFTNECPGFERDDCFKLKDLYRQEWLTEGLPSAQPETPKQTVESTQNIPNRDLISRKVAIDSIQYAGEIGKLTCIDILKRLPSAQSEIIRCRDCKYVELSSIIPVACCMNQNGLVYPRSDTFCSYAERRKE